MALPPNPGDEDPLGGIDPMAWLESLAKRQGANADELTTKADLEVPLPTGDYKIDEPGYTPGYDLGSAKSPAKESPAKPKVDTPKPLTAPPSVPPATPTLSTAPSAFAPFSRVPASPPPPEPEPVAAAPSDDPLSGMDPMAWLESLAKRQGANADELTTKADLEVPLPTGDYTIDEPGYTPGYELAKPAKSEPKPPEPVVAKVEPPAAIPQAEPAAALDPMADPMAWLESLAKRQGANADELTTTADLDVPLPTGDYTIDEPGYTPGYEPAKAEPKRPEPVVAKVEPPVAIPQPEPVAALDPMADPMAWLESLAKRQGANADELTTTADLDVPLPTGDYTIDEPGYTPGYELAKPAKSEPKVIETPAAPVDTQPIIAKAPPPPPAPAPAVADSAIDPMADPIAWLESLARRQGANLDELTTSADLDVPLPPADAIIDEPGYVDYDPFSAKARPEAVSEPLTTISVKDTIPAEALPIESDETSRAWLDSLASLDMAAPDVAPVLTDQEAADFLGIREESPAAAADPLAGMDPFEWLEQLSREQGTDAPRLLDSMADLDLNALDESLTPDSTITTPEATLSWLEGLSDEPEPMGFDANDALLAPPMTAEEAGGLSNDPEELKRWLMAQATQLEDVRDFFEVDSDVAFVSEEEEAVPGTIPSWLLEAQPTGEGGQGEQDAAALFNMLDSNAFSEVIAPPAVPDDVPAWMMERQEAEIGADFLDFTPPDTHKEDSGVLELTPEELKALTMPTSEADVDSWAEALDEEYDRRKAGDDSIPDWYLEAISRVDEDDTAPLEALPLPTGSITVEPDDAEIVSADEFFNIPAAAATSEIPSWLQLQVTEEDDAPAVAGDLPDWLREAKPADIVPASEDELAWLRAEAVQGDAGDLPDWLQMVPPAAPVVEPPAPEPIVARVETRPEPPPASKPAPKVEPKPRQPGRLLAARENVATNLFSKAMELYQQLIDDQEDLEETRADLRTMVENNPKEPKLRRLLGDTHMRLGDLQSALDSYRSALDQL